MSTFRKLAFIMAALPLGFLSGVHVHGDSNDRKKETQEELKQLQGTWRVVAVQLGGKDMPRDEIGPNNLIVIKGLRYTLVTGKRRIECTMTIDPFREPKGIDVTRISDKVTWLGIYELKGDTLKVFSGDKDRRPSEFKTKEGTKQILHVLKRVQQDD